MSRIVIIEDDAYLREELELTFAKSGYEVVCVEDFVRSVEEIAAIAPDLVVLDIKLPFISGFDICKRLKARFGLPVLMLTALDTLPDELQALSLGADDFLTKPCHPRRLLARAERLIQRYKSISHIKQAGQLSLNLDANRVIYQGQSMTISQTESVLFALLIDAFPLVVSKQEFFSTLWGGSEFIDDNILQVNIARLRKSLENLGLRESVETVRGIGYRLVVPDR